MTYNDAFFAGNMATVESARRVLPTVLRWTGARSVIDVGCGVAAWALAALELTGEASAVDGYADHRVLIPSELYTKADLEAGYNCAGFDLAICLEVGEHLPASAAPLLVEGLCRATWVLWSAAPPGQGGAGHINEQWPSYWLPIFRDRGYWASDAPRRAFWHDEHVERCYRQNMALFSTPERLHAAGLAVGYPDMAHPSIMGGPSARCHDVLESTMGNPTEV